MYNANDQKDSREFKVMLGALALLAIASLSTVSVIALNNGVILLNNTGSVSTSKITVPTPVTASGIQAAVNVVIASGGGTVYIPAGDWVINQTAVTFSSSEPVSGGALFIDLETLPAGAWLNIIGSYTNVTTTQQNGQSITCPATILRSYTVNNGYLPGTISTFVIVGSIWHSSANNNYVKSANRHVRISGLAILGDVTNDSGNNNDGIDLGCVDGFLIDHCFIDSSVGADVAVGMSKGVIADCNISQMYHQALGGLSDWGYGIEVSGNSNLWNTNFGTATWITNLTQVIGLYDWQGINIAYSNPNSGSNATIGSTTSISFTAGPIYVENNVFDKCRHAVTSNQYGYFVARYNLFETCNSYAMRYVDVHGEGFPSGRGGEVYNNTFENCGEAIDFRGGGGVICNNTFLSIANPLLIEIEGGGTPGDGLGAVADLWIWSNTYSGLQNNGGYRAGIDYFADVPTPTSPAPPRPSYVPYTYPHPLTLGP